MLFRVFNRNLKKQKPKIKNNRQNNLLWLTFSKNNKINKGWSTFCPSMNYRVQISINKNTKIIQYPINTAKKWVLHMMYKEYSSPTCITPHCKMQRRMGNFRNSFDGGNAIQTNWHTQGTQIRLIMDPINHNPLSNRKSTQQGKMCRIAYHWLRKSTVNTFDFIKISKTTLTVSYKVLYMYKTNKTLRSNITSQPFDLIDNHIKP